MKTAKRMLMAAAAAGAMAAPGAWAQQVPASSVQVYGLLGMYLGRVQISGRPGTTLQMGQGGLVTSYLGFKGSEDLGGGLRTVFALEAWVQPNNGLAGRSAADPFFSRNAYVGLEGSLGRLTAGRQTNPTYLNLGAVSAFGGSTVFSPVVLQSFIASYGGVIIGDTVWNNTLQYTSPTWNGLTVTGDYAPGGVVNRPGLANSALHASYANGAFTAVASTQRMRTAAVAPVTGQTASLVGATYDFRVVKLFGSLSRTQADGTHLDTSTSSAGARVPAGPGAFMLEWARTKVEAATQSTRNTGAIGYDYFLSKRTDVYTTLVHDRLTGAAAGTTYAIGIRHTF